MMQKLISKKAFLWTAIVSFTFIAGALTIFYLSKTPAFFKHKPNIKVGILHSLTGTMAISEKQVVDATLLAIDEINAKGGILGRKIEPVIADGRSDPDIFQKEAERLITKEKVSVIFGCWTSASRKSVKTIVEKYNSLLFYPVQYEGLEESPNIIYMGASPNQQLIPAVNWACNNLGKRFFLIGSDYVFPRVVNEIAKKVILYAGSDVVGEEYILLGGRDFDAIIKRIRETSPDVILNTINGDSNVAFFKALCDAGLGSPNMSIVSLSIGENELKTVWGDVQKYNSEEMGETSKANTAGAYSCWSYFESIDNVINNEFVGKFRKRYGEEYRVTDPMEAAYFGVYLWSQSVSNVMSVDDTLNIVNHLHWLSIPAPEGVISIDHNNHALKTVRIGKVSAQGEFDIVWSSGGPISPDPYPDFQSKIYWKNFLREIYRMYNGRWDAGAVRLKPKDNI